MPNNFESNFTRKLMERVIPRFEYNRVISKCVNTQLFKGKFNPSTGQNIDVQRVTRYAPARTATGDISSAKRDIITGKATATVQDYITVAVDYDEADEALKMGNNQNRYWDDIGRDMVVELETDFAGFLLHNAGLYAGTVGQAVNSFSEIANAGALMAETGVTRGSEWHYIVDNFSQVALAVEQRGLGVNPEVQTANDRATIREAFAGFDYVKTSDALPTYTTQTGADRAGTLSANPDVTYVTAKDTMTQSLAVTGFQANLAVKAGEILQITGRNRVSRFTKNVVIDATGSEVVWSGTVTADVTLGAAGDGTLVVSGPAIYSATDNAYNTADSAPVSGDVVTLLGSASTTYKPSLFFQRDAAVIASVPIKKLHSTDTKFTTKDGLQIRCSLYADGDKNQQTVRFDLRPAYGIMDPLSLGQGYGTA